jgi:hypothetical protein
MRSGELHRKEKDLEDEDGNVVFVAIFPRPNLVQHFQKLTFLRPEGHACQEKAECMQNPHAHTAVKQGNH